MVVASMDDLIDRISNFESIRIGDKIYSAKLLTPQMVVDTADLVSEASTVAALILYWGLMAAQARRAKARVDSAYRAWRDRSYLAIRNKPDDAGKHPSDATAEKMYRSLPEYGVWQQKIDDAQEQAEQAEAIYEAFRAKKEMIIAEQKILNDQSGGSYYVVEGPRKTIPRTPQQSFPSATPEGAFDK